MEPITREEYYLAKIAGTYEGKTPEPVTIEEYYLATMAGDYSGNTPQPVTRLQYYMAKVAGVWGGSIPAPVTRLEYYWAAIANGEGKVFPPVTREEHFLVLVADAYSVVLTVVTGNPALLENSKGNRGLESLTLHGKSTQGSTTGAQLFDVSEVLDEVALDTEKPVASNAVGYWTSGYIPVKTGNYICSPKGTSRGWIYDADKNGLRYLNNPGGAQISIKEGEAFVRVSGKYPYDPQNFMFNEGNSIKPYEPYTGGKPSPSPEYPRPIVSSGDDGSIGLDITGANLINASSIKSEEKLGVKLTNNGDGSFTFKGTTAESYFVTTYNYLTNLVPGEYAFALDGAKNVQACIRYTKNGVNRSWMADSKLSFDGSETNIFFYMQVKPNTTVNETVFPMLNVGSVFLDSEEYKEQFVSIPTPGGLPGIPVSYGGNYTDEKGQQWVCDEVDFKKGVYVQRIGKKTITSKDSFFKSGLSTDDVNYFGLNNFFVHIGTRGEKDVLMSNCFVAGIYQNFGALGKIFLGSASGNVIYFSVNAQKYPDAGTFKQWAVENGLMFLYQLTDIIETPLAAEELSAYKTLCTYSPTTTVINDAGAGMSVGYAKMK